MTAITQPRKAAAGLGMVIGWVIVLAGTMLLASAALKSRQYTLSPVAPRGQWTIRGFESALVGVGNFSRPVAMHREDFLTTTPAYYQNGIHYGWPRFFVVILY